MPPGHLQPTRHLKRLPSDDPIANTWLGQAHFAGTGPAGTTCRECAWWYRETLQGDRKPVIYAREDGVPHHQKCQYPIRDKADRLIPHDAPSCRFFAKNDDAPVARKGKLSK